MNDAKPKNDAPPNGVAQTFLLPVDLMSDITKALGSMPFNQVAPLMARIQRESIAVTETTAEIAQRSDNG